ncbi:NIF3-like protein 1 [Heterodontus francisci]|uniref:NIF3-like protein 1 n=1 Tax=Heterodontus francisci TaxID=7792 RepID=UPI00355BCFD9
MLLSGGRLLVRPLTRRPLMELASVVAALERLAPPALAASWDNVGLLVEPSPPHTVHTMLLTNDLTEGVMEEALRLQAQLVLAYHPPLFHPFRRVTMATWKERLLVRALENRVAIYSPHTAFDASPHGVNDWLAKGLGDCSTVPLTNSTADTFPTPGSHRLEATIPASYDAASVVARLRALEGATVALVTLSSGSRLSLNCSRKALVEAVRVLNRVEEIRASLEVTELQKPPLPDTGMGRLCALREKTSTAAVIRRIKEHLKLAHVRVALGTGRSLDSEVATAAVCAGSGASVLRGVAADLFLTGEMSHHEVLDAVAVGTTVVLCEHSNSERGFLVELRDVLSQSLEGRVSVLVSAADREPLRVM